MRTPLLRTFDPVIHLIVLFLIAFTSVTLLLLLGNNLVQVIWGIDVVSNLEVLSDFSRPEVIHANKLLLFLQHIGLFILPPLVFAQLVSPGVGQYLYLVKPVKTIHWLWAILAMVLAMLPINLLVEWNAGLQLPEALRWLEEIIRSAEQQAELLTEALLKDVSPLALAVNLTLIAVVPAIGEELMFRGAIQRILSQWTRNHHLGIWISAFLFSAIHFQFYGFLPRMALGALFGYMFVWSGSIWLPILAHFINNATAITIHYLIATEVVSPEIDTVGAGSGGVYYSLFSAALLFGLFTIWKRSSAWPVIKPEYLQK